MFGDSLDKIWKGIEQFGKSEFVEEANSMIKNQMEAFSLSSFFEQPEDDLITKETRSIIHKAATSAAIASGAMAQGSIVSFDTPVLVTIHIGMVVAIGAVFGKKVSQANAIALLGAATGVGIGVAGVKSVMGIVPIAGNLANATVSFTYTEALGWFCFKYFKDTVAKEEIMENIFHGDNIHINGGQVGAVGTNARADRNNFIQSEQKQTLAEAAKQIQLLLQQLEKTNPAATESEMIQYVNDETTPSFKRRVIGALQAGGEVAIEEFLDNPYVNVGKAIIKGWIKPE